MVIELLQAQDDEHGLLRRMRSDARVFGLVCAAFSAAETTEIVGKIRALANVVADGLNDDTKLDGAKFIVDVLAELNVIDVRWLLKLEADHRPHEGLSPIEPLGVTEVSARSVASCLTSFAGTVVATRWRTPDARRLDERADAALEDPDPGSELVTPKWDVQWLAALSYTPLKSTQADFTDAVGRWLRSGAVVPFIVGDGIHHDSRTPPCSTVVRSVRSCVTSPTRAGRPADGSHRRRQSRERPRSPRPSVRSGQLPRTR
jgi:hypothetical protein